MQESSWNKAGLITSFAQHCQRNSLSPELCISKFELIMHATMIYMLEGSSTSKYLWAVVVVIFALLLGLGGYGYYFMTRTLDDERGKATTAAKVAAERIIHLEEVNTTLTASTTALEDEILHRKTDYYELLERLSKFETDNIAMQDQVKQMAGELGIYDKLSKTDRELLQKYSKVYFLNENYIPSSLATITPEYLFTKNRPLLIHANVFPELTSLLAIASSSGQSLLVLSAYRSFGEQAGLKSKYVVTFGQGANKFSAEQGYSEHQLGTTIDFTTPALGISYSKIESTNAFAWLTQNAYRFGFVLSYPKNNDYYQYEPWHWRFVGVALARKLHDENKYFYDIPQREIDTYLVSIFDK